MAFLYKGSVIQKPPSAGVALAGAVGATISKIGEYQMKLKALQDELSLRSEYTGDNHSSPQGKSSPPKVTKVIQKRDRFGNPVDEPLVVVEEGDTMVSYSLQDFKNKYGSDIPASGNALQRAAPQGLTAESPDNAAGGGKADALSLLAEVAGSDDMPSTSPATDKGLQKEVAGLSEEKIQQAPRKSVKKDSQDPFEKYDETYLRIAGEGLEGVSAKNKAWADFSRKFLTQLSKEERQALVKMAKAKGTRSAEQFVELALAADPSLVNTLSDRVEVASFAGKLLLREAQMSLTDLFERIFD